MLAQMFKKVLDAYDYYSGKFECVIAQGDEIATCLRIRKEVFGDELKRWKGSSEVSVAEKDPFDEKSVHILCRENKTGQIIGCVRITQASHLVENESYSQAYQLSHFPSSLIPKVTAVSRMAVLKEFRRGPAGLLMASKCYEHELSVHETRLSVVVCEPNLYPLYRRLGYRPLDKVFLSPFGGYRLPLVIVVHDYSYLRDIRSPFYEIAQRHRFPAHMEGLEWFHKMDVIEPGFTLLTSKSAQEQNPVITDGLSEKGKEELLKNSILIHCHYGDPLLKKEAKEKFFGFVKKGAIEVISNGKLIAMLGEEDIFGEMAFILDCPSQVDLITAQPDTEVVLVGLSAIQRLSNTEDKIQIWKNLAHILAIRLTEQVWISSGVSKGTVEK